MSKIKLGVLGGAFDPITAGHMQLARLAAAELDEVVLMPSYVNHFGKNLTPSKHRLAMCQRAADELPDNVTVSDFEISRKMMDETVYIMRYFRNLNKDKEVFFIMGADAYDGTVRWKTGEEFLNEQPCLVFSRKNYVAKLEPNSNSMFRHADIIDTSSTVVRKLIAVHSEDIMLHIVPSVFDYIKENKLYNV